MEFYIYCTMYDFVKEKTTINIVKLPRPATKKAINPLSVFIRHCAKEL